MHTALWRPVISQGLWAFQPCFPCLSFGLLFVIRTIAGALGLAVFFLFLQVLLEFMTLPVALSGGPAFACFGSLVIACVIALRCFLACFALFVMPASTAASWRTTMVQAGVQESIADVIIRLGYDEEACSVLLLLISKPLRVG